MASVFDVSKDMGEYLLKGWTLTNDPCPSCSVPRMKSPPYTGTNQLICVNCDAKSEPPKVNEDTSPRQSLFTESGSRLSISTPPTDISPPDSPPFALPPPSQEALARRAQSDRASQEIGSKLLQGWTMLADECPNPTCYGIPLVRPPGGSKMKECVICGNRYMSEGHLPAGAAPVAKQPTPTINELEATPSSTIKGKGRGVLNNTQESVAPIDATISMRDLNNHSSTHAKLSALNSLPGHLEQSLVTLEKLLINATSTANVQRIGEIADAISKVSIALQNVSTPR